MSTITTDGIFQISPADLPRDSMKYGMDTDRRGLRLVARLNPWEGCIDAPEMIPAGGVVEISGGALGVLQSAFIFRT